ncbi:MAG: acetolactate synthase small subunit [Lachnospiraceae bacterium]|nr:acetolactate synthase small subunit [Lachnospiraceae bacterium]
MKKKVLSILVDNSSGVLSRVAGLFSRRGYNIDSLTVGETENPIYSRMTVVAKGDDQILDQIKKQLEKLEDVREVIELTDGHSVTRELVLITVGVAPDKRNEITSLAEIFRANIVDVELDSVMVELTGNQRKINAFIELLENYEIKELVRTGIAGLSRGGEGISEKFMDD